MDIDFIDYQGPNFSLHVPTIWYVTSTPAAQVLFVAPQDEKYPAIQANMVINQRRMQEGVTLQQLIDLSKESQKKEYTDYRLLKEEKTGAVPFEVYQRRYTWKNREDVPINQLQVMILSSDRLMSITATRENKDELQILDQVFAYMISSLKFTAPGQD